MKPRLQKRLLQASLPATIITVQKTSLLKDSQAWNSQDKFKRATPNQNLLLNQLILKTTS